MMQIEIQPSVMKYSTLSPAIWKYSLDCMMCHTHTTACN